MAKVINLWGGPGSGKSTTAAGLFFKMKLAGYKVELVTEYAKELVYDGLLRNTDQMLILKEQFKRQDRLKGKVDFIITDSGLLLSKIYAPHDDETGQLADRYFKMFDNINFYIKRVKPYLNYGRNQTEQEARQLDRAIQKVLSHFHIRAEVLGDNRAPTAILNYIKKDDKH